MKFELFKRGSSIAAEIIRSFIAIELPDDLRKKIGELEAKLTSRNQNYVRWVKPESIHLTLNFLGDVQAEKVPEIVKAMEVAAEGIPPFVLRVQDTGVFPNVRRARVAWVGLSGDVDKLVRLQKNLEIILEPLGFTPEGRDFTPHLTLARINDAASQDERQKFGELVLGTKFEGGVINVDGVSLMRSQLERTGAIYTQLALVKLK